jgi:amino acid transporter
MEPLLMLLVVLVVAVVAVLRFVVLRKARERAERGNQVPTMPKVAAAALLGAAFLAIGITILVTAPDLSQGSDSGRYGWVPAWIQAAVLLVGGVGFEYLALTNLRKLRRGR